MSYREIRSACTALVPPLSASSRRSKRLTFFSPSCRFPLRPTEPSSPPAPLADFTECMRSLGYPRIISVENFRNPNFELVADCLDWLVQRFDESADIDDDISTETDRVTFLKNVSKVFMSRARLKLNIKRLYAADGYARPRRPPSSTLLQPSPPTFKSPSDIQGTRAHLAAPPVRPTGSPSRSFSRSPTCSTRRPRTRTRTTRRTRKQRRTPSSSTPGLST